MNKYVFIPHEQYEQKSEKMEEKSKKGVEQMNGFKNGPKIFNPAEEIDTYCNGSGVDQLFFSYECNEFMTIGTYKVIQVTE